MQATRRLAMTITPAAAPAVAAAAASGVVATTAGGAPPWLHRSGVVLRSFGVFFAVWWVLAAFNGNPIQLPEPWRVARALWDLAREVARSRSRWWEAARRISSPN